MVEVVGDVVVTDDRPGDELREEGLVRAVEDRIPFGPDHAAIHVDQIGDALEGEERDADGEENPSGDGGDAGACKSVDILGEESDIFEVAEQREIEADEAGDDKLRRPRLDHQAAREIDHDAEDQDPRVVPRTPEVKQEAREQHERSEAEAPEGQAAGQRDRQKQEEEARVGEDQRKTLLPSCPLRRSNAAAK